MRDMRWVPGMEVEEDEEMEQSYGNRMPPVDDPDFTYKVEFICRECGGMNRHLRSCSEYKEES